MALLQVKVSEDLKTRSNELFKELGLDLTTAIRIYLKKCVLEGGIPFDIKLGEYSTEALKTTPIKRDNLETDEDSEDDSEDEIDY